MYVHNTSDLQKLLANLKGVQSWRRRPAQSQGIAPLRSCLEQELTLISLITTPPSVIRHGNT